MKYRFIAVISFLFLSTTGFCQNGKLISDLTVEYSVNVDPSSASPEILKSMNGATKTMYLKGSKSRIDLITSTYQQTTLFDSKTDSSIILREIGANRYMSYVDEPKRMEQNKRFVGATFSPTNEKKTILGYECVKAIVQLKDGTNFSAYYAPTVVPANKEYEFRFKNLPGFVLEYEEFSEDGKTRINYVANKISLTPVPASKFDVPKAGYRLL